MVGLAKGRISLSEWVDDFNVTFKREQNLIKQAISLDDIVMSVVHVGSTSIMEALSRPIIDILVTVPSIASVKPYLKKMAIVGYQIVPNKTFKDVLYFEKYNGDGLYSTLYLTKENSETAKKILSVKKYLSSHGNLLNELNEIKRKVIKKGASKEKMYNSKKYSFLKKIEKMARKDSEIKVQIKKPTFK